MADTRNTPASEPPEENAPGTPQRPEHAGLVDGGDRDVSDRPQADPEVPELGASDRARGQLPDKDATGF